MPVMRSCPQYMAGPRPLLVPGTVATVVRSPSSGSSSGPDVSALLRATRCACAELLLPDASGGTLIAPDAMQAVLAMIVTWGVPVLRLDDSDLERTWLWADLHLCDGSTVWVHRRPFWTRAFHDRALTRCWRRTVAAGDTVIHVGDFAPETVHEARRSSLLRVLPGSKINVLGNHDVAAPLAPLTDGWDRSYGALVIASTPPLVVTHCPLRTVPSGTVNVHGHMHRRRDRRLDPRINVAVEQTGYRPVRASHLVVEAARRLRGEHPIPLTDYSVAGSLARPVLLSAC